MASEQDLIFTIYGRVSIKLARLKARFETLLTQETGEDGEPQIQSDDEKVLMESVTAFEGETGEEATLQKDLEELQSLDSGPEVQKLVEQFAHVRQLYVQLKKAVASLVECREEIEIQIQKILADQKKMHDWAKNELEKLESEKGNPAGLKRMCDSLMKNRGQAEQNVIVLLESAQHHIPEPVVEAAMKDLLEVWRKLQVELYEQTHKLLLAEHKESGATDILLKYLTVGQDKVLPALESVDRSSLSDDAAAKLHKLKEDGKPHQIIVEHLSDFDTRTSALLDHYDYVRTTVTSQMAQLCQQLGGSQLAYKDRQRYERSVDGLRSWLNHAESWTEVQDKLKGLQDKLVSQEA